MNTTLVTRHLVAAMVLLHLCGILLLLFCLGLRPRKPAAVAIGTVWLPSAEATLRQTPLGTSSKVLKKPAARKHGSQHSSSHPAARPEAVSVAPSKSARQIHAAEARATHVQELGPSLNGYLDDMGLSLAQRRTVSVTVIKRYLGEVEQFASWALLQPNGGALKHLGQPIIDQLLTQYVDRLVAFHMEPHVGRDLIAGVMFVKPHWVRPQRVSLPSAVRALQGWVKDCPPTSRLPMPEEVVFWMALEALEMGVPQIALAILLIFIYYLRPMEVFKCRLEDFVRPIGSVVRWTLILHPAELFGTSKTFEQDETLMLMVAQYEFIAIAAHRFLNKQRQKGVLLIDATQQQVNTFIRDFWRRHGLDKIGSPHLYRLRHAGASVGLAQNQVDRNTLQRALRHQAPRSTRRYEKGGRLSQMTAKLPEHVVLNVHARLKAKLAQL